MIDWIGIITNGTWILGLSIVIATWSYADWFAALCSRASRTRMREVLGQAAFRIALWSGLTLFCVGVALAGGRWWERILWGVLAAMSAVEVWQARRALCTSEGKS
jgi:hypothetical protein